MMSANHPLFPILPQIYTLSHMHHIHLSVLMYLSLYKVVVSALFVSGIDSHRYYIVSVITPATHTIYNDKYRGPSNHPIVTIYNDKYLTDNNDKVR